MEETQQELVVHQQEEVVERELLEDQEHQLQLVVEERDLQIVFQEVL